MARVVYIIANHDTGQAYAGLTREFRRRVTEHRRTRPHLFTGRHIVFSTDPMTDAIAQHVEAKAVRYLRSLGFHTVNVKRAGSLGSASGSRWDKETCATEALKYETRKDFERNASGAYVMAQRRGWLSEICAHMTYRKKPKGYWTKERCAVEAAKYMSRAEFKRSAISVYNTAERRGWLGEICYHMTYRKRRPVT
jgi:predicted GIY-YIG superfamily endonuclease